MASFYRDCGGDYDQLFLSMPPQSIAFIYARLECPHSLQPPTTHAFSLPAIPALKHHGFVKWQTIQLLLGPAEHVPFIQNALHRYDIRDPDTSVPFPKSIPASCFPSEPDPDMLAWYEGISSRLRNEAQQGTRIRKQPARESSPETSPEESGSTDERVDAAGFFANPLYRNKDGRPAIVQQLTKAPAKMLQSGKTVAQNVFIGGKMILSPNTFGGPARKKSRSRSPAHGRESRHTHTSSHGYNSPCPQSSNLHPLYQGPARQPSRKDAQSPTSSEEAELEADERAFELDRRRRMHRRGSHDSRPESGLSAGGTAGTRRRHSADYRQGAGDGSGAGRPFSANISSGGHAPTPGDRDRDRDREIQTSRSPPIRAARAPHTRGGGGGGGDDSGQGYFDSGYTMKQQPHARRPSMPYRTTSEQYQPSGRRASADKRPANGSDKERGGGGRVDDGYGSGHGSGYGSTDSRHYRGPRGDAAGAAAAGLSPSVQEEWNGVRQTVSGAAEGPGGGGGGVRFADKDDERDGGGHGDRRLNGGKVAPPVNGVKGRVYPNEAPWDSGS